MKDNKIRRFSVLEIMVHWLNAACYLTLLTSGIFLLGKKVFALEIFDSATLIFIHKTAGILLVSLLLLLYLLINCLKRGRSLQNTLQQSLNWNFSDLEWLFKVPVNMFFKNVTLPPAARFNGGQKLHLLVVLTVLAGFSYSGVVMLLAPTVLLPWIVHLLCFALALAFLLLHLFLSLVNPSTAKSLPAIFTGFVSTEYARKHHSLWLTSKPGATHESYVSLPAIFITLLAALTGAILLFYPAGFKQSLPKLEKLITREGAPLVEPGSLIKNHAVEIKLRNCTACHLNLLTPASSACLDCHKLIKERRQSQSGYHGKLKGECNSCHPEHLGSKADIRRFAQKKFDHNSANYKLVEKHRKLPCEKCHLVKSEDKKRLKKIKYIGLTFTKCLACHHDPHQGRFKKPCTSCHSEKGWKQPNLLFSHNQDSKFKIDQIHSQLKCVSCHQNFTTSLSKPLPDSCKKCHQNIEDFSFGKCQSASAKPDPHAGRVTCRQCHPANLYRQKATAYAEKCQSCHTSKYKQLYYDWKEVFRQDKQKAKTLRTNSAKQKFATTQLKNLIKEADSVSFHNIHLAAKLWDKIISPTESPDK